MKIKAKIIIGIISLMFLSCSKNDEVAVPNEEGNLDIQFDNIYAGANLVFDTNYTSCAKSSIAPRCSTKSPDFVSKYKTKSNFTRNLGNVVKNSW